MLWIVVGLPFDVSRVVCLLLIVEWWLLFVGCVVVCGVCYMVFVVRCLLGVVYSSLASLCCLM